MRGILPRLPSRDCEEGDELLNRTGEPVSVWRRTACGAGVDARPTWFSSPFVGRRPILTDLEVCPTGIFPKTVKHPGDGIQYGDDLQSIDGSILRRGRQPVDRWLQRTRRWRKQPSHAEPAQRWAASAGRVRHRRAARSARPSWTAGDAFDARPRE